MREGTDEVGYASLIERGMCGEVSPSTSDVELEFSYDTEYFRVMYTLTGPNAVPPLDKNRSGTPDYVERIGAAAEAGRALMVDDQGWQDPLVTSEGTLPGPVTIRVEDTEPSWAEIQNHSIAIDNQALLNVRSRRLLESIVIHEVVHLCQSSTIAAIVSAIRFGEPVAAYFQMQWTDWGDTVLARAHRDVLIGKRLGRPELQIYDELDLVFKYSNFLFFHYMVERLRRHQCSDREVAVQAVREIYEKIGDGIGGMQAVEEAFEERGLPWERAMAEYALWNVMIGPHATRDYGYPDARHLRTPYGGVKVAAEHHTYPVPETDGPNPPWPTGTTYLKFHPAARRARDDLTIRVAPKQAGDTLVVTVVRVPHEGEARPEAIGAIDTKTEIVTENPSEYRAIIVGLTNPAYAATWSEYKLEDRPADYEYSAD